MIIGIGTDLVSIERIDKLLSRWGARALRRLFTPYEIQGRPTLLYPVRYFAKRFAAKEAFVKALGTGFTHNISFQDIEITNDPLGKPLISLKGVTAQMLSQRTAKGFKSQIHLSLSDTDTQALAFVIIEQVSL